MLLPFMVFIYHNQLQLNEPSSCQSLLGTPACMRVPCPLSNYWIGLSPFITTCENNGMAQLTPVSVSKGWQRPEERLYRMKHLEEDGQAFKIATVMWKPVCISTYEVT